MQFTKGQQVIQVLPPAIAGTVAGFSVDQETGAIQVRVEWASEDAEGAVHAHERFFTGDELTAA